MSVFSSATKKAHARSRGFTLPELMIVVAIVGILSGLVISAANNNKYGDTVRKVSREIFATVNHARTAAISDGGTVYVEILQNSVTAFRDSNANRIYDVGADSSVYRYVYGEGIGLSNGGTLGASISVNTTGLTAYAEPVMMFDRNGFSVDAAGDPTGSYNNITISSTGATDIFVVKVTVAGAVKVLRQQ